MAMIVIVTFVKNTFCISRLLKCTKIIIQTLMLSNLVLNKINVLPAKERAH